MKIFMNFVLAFSLLFSANAFTSDCKLSAHPESCVPEYITGPTPSKLSIANGIFHMEITQGGITRSYDSHYRMTAAGADGSCEYEEVYSLPYRANYLIMNSFVDSQGRVGYTFTTETDDGVQVSGMFHCD
jgi:hypothetical protein